MSHLFNNMVRTVFCAAILLLFTSYGPVKNTLNESMLLEGNYTLKATGDFNLELKGEIHFETALKISGDGTPFSILELNLENDKKESRHSMGFLISEQNRPKGISEGIYKVPKDIDGFLNYFDGVFGFANIEGMGELPFFAQKGRITIHRIHESSLRGTIEVTMQNSNGKKVNVIGDFTAVKQN